MSLVTSLLEVLSTGKEDCELLLVVVEVPPDLEE